MKSRFPLQWSFILYDKNEAIRAICVNKAATPKRKKPLAAKIDDLNS